MVWFYSVAVIYLPIKIIKTAGTSIPMSGTNTEGNQLATMSVDIIYINISITLNEYIDFVVFSLLYDIKFINFLYV